MVRKALFSLLIIGGMAAAPVAFAQEDPAMGSGMGDGTTMDDSSMGGAAGTTTPIEGCETEAEKQTQRCMDLMREQGMQPDATTPGTEGGAGMEGGSSQPGGYGN